MRKTMMAAAVVASLTFPTAPRAGFTLGGRTGLAFGMGEAYELSSEGLDMSDDFVALQIPLQLDLGFRINPAVQVGGYLSLGAGIPGSNITDVCDDFDLDCSAYVVRLGVQASYAWTRPGRAFAPWVGLGFGYEWAGYSMEGGGDSYEESASGLELLNLQAGADFRVSRIFAFGPWIMLGFAQYSDGTAKARGSQTFDVDIFDFADETWHRWLYLGIRGEFEFGGRR